MRLYITFLLILGLFFSCNQLNKEETILEGESSISGIDFGHLLKNIQIPVKGYTHLPRLFKTSDALHLSWVEQRDSLSILKYARYQSDQWSDPKLVTSGTDWFINWADFPSLSVNGETVLTNVLQKSAEGTYDYDIKLSLIDTLSRKRRPLVSGILLNTDGVAAEHGFLSSQPYKDGFSVSWLDGRNTKNKDQNKNQMTLRNAFVSKDGKISEETEIDDRVCDCCNTATTVTSNGPIVVYRDRSRGTQEIRDMYIVRKIDGKWTKPIPINQDNWQLNGCPVNGPAIDASGMNVVVSWFTAQGDTPRVLVAFSKDGGKTFGKPYRVDNGNAIGRVGAQLLKDGSALLSWLEPNGAQTVLKITRINNDGTYKSPITVTNTSAERQSGFPQLAVMGNQVYVAFTELNGAASQVKMIHFSLDKSPLN